MSIQIRRLAGIEHYVRDLARTRRFYVERMGLLEVGGSPRNQRRSAGHESRVFRAGSLDLICSSPREPASPAARYLARHPDGIGSLVFEVADIRRAFARLERNGATPLAEIEKHEDAHGSIESFSIATPLGDTLFRFIERRGYRGALPGLEANDVAGVDDLGLAEVDHVTANFRTMKPALLWLEQVLEFRAFWDVQFHSGDSEPDSGSGLRSQVLWDPTSGVKIASNEPLRPAFERSQISVFCEQNGGDGIQHVALGVSSIVHTVRALRARGVALMPAPPGYYQRLPEHLRRLGIERLQESPRLLAELGVLVDGSGPGAYLLQIFLQDSAHLLDSADAGPFFFELIQREGDTGFGAGNFRALFASVERQQLKRTA
jgi:4-hydroxyphenylpyruvate dioxygenase